MKRFILLISILASALFSNAALAEGYWGTKVAMVDIDANNFDKALNLGIFVGAEFAQSGSNIISLEGELTTSLIDGDTSLAGVDWSVQTIAVYAAMRTGRDAYLKVKAGFLDSEITFSSVGATVSDSGFSWGAGFGFNNYEIEYTFIDRDGGADLSMISLNYLF